MGERAWVGYLKWGLLLGASLWSGVVSAHHPMGGGQPETAVESILSGIGHPIIGLDHLSFMIALGLFLAVLGKNAWVALATFLGGTVAGLVVGHVGLVTGAIEVSIALSLIVMAGFLVLSGSVIAKRGWPVIGGLGVIHGVAYAEAIVGSNMVLVFWYALGFLCVQAAIVALVVSGTRYFWKSSAGAGLVWAKRYGAGFAGAAGFFFVGAALLN